MNDRRGGPTFPYELTAHALAKVTLERIPLDWVQRVIEGPTERAPEPEDANVTRAWARIPEYGDRVLRVVYNHATAPYRIVTVTWDRGKGRQWQRIGL